jgi:hypothetical protein
MVMDVSSRKIDNIPSLKSSENSVPPDSECGIHREDDSGRYYFLLISYQQFKVTLQRD